MNLNIEALKQAMNGNLGATLLDEISQAQWTQNHNHSIDELGISYGTTLGLIRARNEDRAIVSKITAANGETYIACIVCDGVGGSEQGNVAAEITIATLVAEFSYTKIKLSLSDLLRHAIKRADEKVRECLKGKGTTTLSIAIASSSGDFSSANIGDSRIFSWTPEAHKRLQQISIDDTLENALAKLKIHDASALAQKGLLGALSQAIGEADRGNNSLEIRIQDRGHFGRNALLASDGVWKSSPDAFELIILNSKTPIEATKRSLALANWTGGIDNASIIIIDNIENLIEECKKHASESKAQLTVKYWLTGNKYNYNEIYLIPSENYKSKAPKEGRKSNRKQPANKIEHQAPQTQPAKQMDLTIESSLEKKERRNIEKATIEISTDQDNTKN